MSSGRRISRSPSGATTEQAVRAKQFVTTIGSYLRGRTHALVLAAGIVVNGAVLITHSVGVWFWADDWDLLFLRGTIDEYDQGLFAPHNNHWFTAHVLVYRIIFAFFGMRSYTPYAVTAVCFHLAIVLVLFFVLRRAGSGPWLATFATLTVAFFGLGANAEIYAASLNHVGALLFGLLAILASLSNSSERRSIVQAGIALTISLMFGLTGLSMVFFATILAARLRGVRSALATALPPVAVLGLWWAIFATQSSANSISPEYDLINDLPHIPQYMWIGLTKTLGDGSGLSGAGPVLVLVIVASLFHPGHRSGRLHSFAACALLAALFQLAIVAVARFNFGADQLGTSHYSYINIVLLMPAIAFAVSRCLDWCGEPRLRAQTVTTLLFIAYCMNGIVSVRTWQSEFTLLTGGGEELALGIKASAQQGLVVLNEKNPDPYNAQLIPKYIATKPIMRALPDRPPTAQGLINAQSHFYTKVSADGLGLASPGANLTFYSGFKQRPLGSGCHKSTVTAADPILTLDTNETGNEIVVWSNSTEVTTRLVRGDVEGPTTKWQLSGSASHIATSAPNARLYIAFNGSGTFTICLA